MAQIHNTKKWALDLEKVAFDAERTAKGGHADRFRAVALACQKVRGAPPGRGEIGVRELG